MAKSFQARTMFSRCMWGCILAHKRWAISVRHIAALSQGSLYHGGGWGWGQGLFILVNYDLHVLFFNPREHFRRRKHQP